eukprot:comp19394_c0_seq1/m.22419 comp19394_c0_seq1/g.22419  ORF comp19394_c0_seq1/g.22419 comp19394_c0_seq1/m.22419 type:complete len:273 (-) comp19394_c0_seq1:616-1434(-)
MSSATLQPSVARYTDARIGFLGVGTLASAMVEGLCTLSETPAHVFLSPRSREHTARLVGRFPTLCTACSTIQEVVDNSDWLVLALPPSLAPQVLQTLKCRTEQVVLTVMAMISLEDVKKFVAPAATVVYSMPLPSIAHHHGVSIIRSQHEGIQEMLGNLGGVFSVESNDQVDLLQAVACLMGPVYGLMATAVEWMEERGVQRNLAEEFAGSLLASVASDAVDTKKPFDTLVKEQTPGGINEAAVARLRQLGVYDNVKEVLAQNLARVQSNRV